jgi:hypothetical protein
MDVRARGQYVTDQVWCPLPGPRHAPGVLVPRSAYGRATGLERACDNLGALIGPLLASLLVALVGVRHTILFAIVPGVLAAVAITYAAREARRTLATAPARRRLQFNLRELWHAGLPPRPGPRLRCSSSVTLPPRC